MVTQQQFKEHFRHLRDSNAIYLWGANGQIISKELVDKLFKMYGSNTYNRAYYDAKLEEGKGKIGADCSGAIYPLSGADNTASGYYHACPTKGAIKDMPKNVACLVFNKNLTHVAAYMGDGTSIEMKSSADNVHEEVFNAARWTYYGIPSWLGTATEEGARNWLQEGDKGDEVKAMQEGLIYLGYDLGKYGADGDFGDDTEKAVKEFQADNGLIADGEYGPLSKDALEKAVANKKAVNVGAERIYRVQTGSFDYRHYAEGQLKGLKGLGFADAFINVKNGKFKVQTGAFTIKKNADEQLAKVRKLGYTDAFIA